MPQNTSHLEFLFQRFSNNEASEEEVRELFRLIGQEQHNYEFVRLLETEMELSAFEPEGQERRDEVLLKIKEVIGGIEAEPVLPAKQSNFRWLALAASVILVIGVAVFFFRSGNNADMDKADKSAVEIGPGKQGATLMLANGKKIHLTDAVNGELAKEAGVVISKSAAGQLNYVVSGDRIGGQSNQLNTLSTAKGETYMVTLPDKSKVWLNAGSSITYAVNLIKRGVRNVNLEGEAYFEITKDKTHPFVVTTVKQEVEVLGTHFNINSYKDESGIKTTLLEGSVKVSLLREGGRKQVLPGVVLKPNQQSAVGANSGIMVGEADPNATAWVMGKFRFYNTPLADVMRQLARWYDVEVVYPQGIPDRKFTGDINRNLNASEALSLLDFMKVKFKIEGKRIIVTK